MKITVTDESGNTYQELGVSRTSDVLGDCDWVESGENGLNIDEVWTIDFEVDLSFKKNLYQYTYVPNGYCVSVSQGDDAFYCHQGILPSSPVASFNDLYIVFHDEEFSFIPAGLRGYFVSNPGGGNNEVFNGRGIEDVFGDQWVWPYGFYNQAALHASVCQGLSGSQLSQCRLDADDYVRNVNYFIAPTASPPYEFGAGYDVVLPADAEWDWELESTVEFAPNTYLIVEGTLDADGITLAASDAATGWGGIRFLQGSDGTLENTAISGVGRVCPTGTCLDGTSVYIDKASPVFDNVDISTTSGAGTVHGVYVRGQQSFPHFLDTTIRDQSGDGIILTTRAKVFLDKAIVEDNGDDGIAAGFNTTAYLRETIIENNGGEGAIAFSGGEIAFGETGGPFGVTDGYNEVRMNGGFGLFAKKNSTIRAGDLASTRYNSIEGNAGTAKAAGSSAVAYVDYNYWGGGEPTLSQANGGQTYANRYCTQAPVLNSGCPSLPFGTSGSRVRGSDTDPAFASRYRRSGQASESGRRHAAQGDSTALEVISGANMMAALGQTEEAFAALTSVVEGYRADPSAGAAFGAIARLFLRDDIAGAIAFLDREAGSEETAHRLWAKEALARSYDALGQSEAAIKAADALDREVATSLSDVEEGERLDWEIAGGVVRYYVLLQSERMDEAEAELEALRLLAPDHEVVQTIVDEAADVLPGWDGVVAEGGSAPSSQSESVTATKDGDSGGVELGAVYPNPANRAVTVPLDLADRADLRVTVYDVLGREVAVVHEGAQGAGAHALTFDTASLTPGFYVVRAAGAGPVQTQRFSVVR